MILSTHAIAGAAVSALLPHHPVLAFCAAFGSHFVLDAIPHWEYRIRSYIEDPKNPLKADMVLNKAFLIDLAKIGVDFSAGIFFSVLVFQAWGAPFNWNIVIGAIGGMVPDFLQFAYWKLRIKPLQLLQRFHIWIHAKKKLNNTPVLGVITQIIFVILLILVFRYLLGLNYLCAVTGKPGYCI